MPAPIDLGAGESRVAWVLRWLTAAATAACAGCFTSSGDTTPPECRRPTGSYVLAVTATGQSEDLAEGGCSASSSSATIEVSFYDGDASIGGEDCLLCSTASCQMDVVCGQSVACNGAVVPLPNPPADYVQIVSFVLPVEAGASTPSAVVELGPDYCGYAGTASVASP